MESIECSPPQIVDHFQVLPLGSALCFPAHVTQNSEHFHVTRVRPLTRRCATTKPLPCRSTTVEAHRDAVGSLEAISGYRLLAICFSTRYLVLHSLSGFPLAISLLRLHGLDLLPYTRYSQVRAVFVAGAMQWAGPEQYEETGGMTFASDNLRSVDI